MNEETKLYDEATLLRAYLVSIMPGGSLIFGETLAPSGSYTPASGAAYCFKIRQGNRPGECEALRTISVIFKVFAQDEVLARAASFTLEKNLLTHASANIMNAELEMAGSTYLEPGSGPPEWTYVMSAFQFLIRVI